jgi:hypothetical protein
MLQSAEGGDIVATGRVLHAEAVAGTDVLVILGRAALPVLGPLLPGEEAGAIGGGSVRRKEG